MFPIHRMRRWPWGRRMMLGFLATITLPLLTFSSFAMSATSESVPGIVVVESSYLARNADGQANGKRTVVRGRGFLVRAAEGTFVVTAAHVSQGGVAEGKPSTTIRLGDEQLATRRRYAANMADVEILEVALEPSVPVFARWLPRKALPPQLGSFRDGGFVLTDEALKTLIATRATIEQRIGAGQTVLNQAEARLAWYPLGSLTFVPHPRSAAFAQSLFYLPPGEAAKLPPSPERQALAYGFWTTANEQFVFQRLGGGLSGLPIASTLRLADGETALVTGMVKAHDRVFRQSWTVDWQDLTQFFNFFMSVVTTVEDGRKNFLADNVFWHERQGVLFREGRPEKLPFTIRETSFIKQPSANGTRADSGEPDANSEASSTLGPELAPTIAIQKAGGEFTDCYGFALTAGDERFLLAPDMSSLRWLHWAALYEDAFSRPMKWQTICDPAELATAVQRRFQRLGLRQAEGEAAYVFRAWPVGRLDAGKKVHLRVRAVPAEETSPLKVTLTWPDDELTFALEGGSIRIGDAPGALLHPVISGQTREGKTFTLNLFDVMFTRLELGSLPAGEKLGSIRVRIDGRDLILIPEAKRD